MSLTIGEVLENAVYNIENTVTSIVRTIGKQQQENCKLLINAGYEEDDDFYESWKEYKENS